ncbi:MAG: hypothetical protein KGQ41_02250, partial [Alphaproteobacteria bacterium]|nr:hypothetical protein [Alphaproteobacteria bacterium]
MNIDTQFLITFFSAVVAGLSFIAVVLPFVKKLERKERYQETIARQRKDMIAAQRVAAEKKAQQQKNQDAKESIQSAFKVRQLVGDMADDLRARMQQAGKRSPNAVLFFLIARFVLPVVFILLAMFFISKSQKEIADGVKLLIIMGLGWFGFSLPGIM